MIFPKKIGFLVNKTETFFFKAFLAFAFRLVRIFVKKMVNFSGKYLFESKNCKSFMLKNHKKEGLNTTFFEDINQEGRTGKEILTLGLKS